MSAPRLVRPETPRAKTGIVHLGLGAFFRAFGCPYVADAMAASGGDWGIIGVSLRSPETRDALQGQGWAFTSVTLSPDAEKLRVIDVLNEVLVAPENPQAVLNAMSDPSVKIISLTVTEKGYCHHPSTGLLNRGHPDIVHDIANEIPRSALGYLVRGLQMRMRAGGSPFTVLTCDNLPQNGQLVQGLVEELAELIDPPLANWIKTNGRFPCTMVDRITPATTADDIARVQILTGFYDAAPVLHEPFSQWVIEDTFVEDARPDFAAAGAQLVADVAAFEDMKLRMLNGTHSALAYTGYLASHMTIADTVADPVFADFARALWSEIMPNVAAPDGVLLTDYAAALLSRYANTNIHHKTWQIAMDGSQKLPQRILGTIGDAYKKGQATPMLCLSIAAWMRFVGGSDEAGRPIDVKDPLAVKLRELSDGADSAEDYVAALLSVCEIFPPELADQLREPVTQAAKGLWESGTRVAIMNALASR